MEIGPNSWKSISSNRNLGFTTNLAILNMISKSYCFELFFSSKVRYLGDFANYFWIAPKILRWVPQCFFFSSERVELGYLLVSYDTLLDVTL